MAEVKTQKNDASVDEFLRSIENTTRRSDAMTLRVLMTELSGEEPIMWGKSIVGFGTYTCTYSSGRTGEWMRIAPLWSAGPMAAMP